MVQTMEVLLNHNVCELGKFSMGDTTRGPLQQSQVGDK